jgi:hypothetical protein
VFVKSLPFGPTFASYYGVRRSGVTREFTCQVSFADSALPGGGVGGALAP